MEKYAYKIKGMHCPACVLVIEDRLEKEERITSVEVSLKKQKITIESKKIISTDRLNQIFKNQNYQFKKIEEGNDDNTIMVNTESLWWLWAILIVGFFLILSALGLASFFNISNNSSLLAIFAFGIIAGFSGCGALMSGIILSAPKNTPQILLGRTISYALLGGILGLIGKQFIVSPIWSLGLTVVISIIMMVVALQMFGVKTAQQISLHLPKSFSKKITQNRLPFVVGLLTVFLPCGFTLLTEGVAVLSGSFGRGLLTMLVFVLGTSIPLFLIGLSSDKLIKNQKLIGAIIFFFIFYNLNFQFGWLNSFSKPSTPQVETQTSETSTVKNSGDEKIIKMIYSTATDISPNSLTLKKDQTVKIEITVNDSAYGCMSTIMIPGLFNRAQTLTKGETIVMEFTPDKIGDYPITCAMGIKRGTINVVE